MKNIEFKGIPVTVKIDGKPRKLKLNLSIPLSMVVKALEENGYIVGYFEKAKNGTEMLKILRSDEVGP